MPALFFTESSQASMNRTKPKEDSDSALEIKNEKV